MKSTLAITAVIFTVGLVTLPVVFSDDDLRWGELGEYKHKSTGVANINNPVYKEECGSCHMAYLPGLLPEKSWLKMMSSLDDHFGENAELDAETQKLITTYLVSNSAEKSNYRRSSKISRSIKNDDVPLRISETPYFKHEHDEIPVRMVTGNPKVNSFSNCNACHNKAEQGLFDEHDIRIPGYGRWDD